MKILGDASFASLNQMFANIAIWSYRHKWQVMLMCCVAFGACGYLAQKVRMDNSFEAFLTNRIRPIAPITYFGIILALMKLYISCLMRQILRMAFLTNRLLAK